MSNTSPHIDRMKDHPLFVDSYPRTVNTTMFVYDIRQFPSIVEPFLNGKYSKIDRQYVTSKFPIIEGRTRSLNREILDMSPRIRDYQSNRIGIKLPDNAEVWDKPVQAKEVFGFSADN